MDSIITGHSTVMTVADLQEYAAFNTDFKNTVQAGKKAGKTVDEIAAAYKIPEKVQGLRRPRRSAPEEQRPDRVRRNPIGQVGRVGSGLPT